MGIRRSLSSEVPGEMSHWDHKCLDSKGEREAEAKRAAESEYKADTKSTPPRGQSDAKGDFYEEESKGAEGLDLGSDACLRINWMNMRDAETGKILWRSSNWGDDWISNTSKEKDERLPKEILKCRTVSREINFSSSQELSAFHMEQYVYLHGHVIEQWAFKFGFVMANSTNSWQQVIEAADPDKMLDYKLLSGNVLFVTCFFNGSKLLGKSSVRLFYL